jgi:hypothetical protein
MRYSLFSNDRIAVAVNRGRFCLGRMAGRHADQSGRPGGSCQRETVFRQFFGVIFAITSSRLKLAGF